LLSRLFYDLAGTPFPTQAPALAAVVGTDHLLYGSDYCFTPPAAVADQIAALDTAAAPENHPGWRELTIRNAERLLPGKLLKERL
jgi:predicted TIM-barrel fold metal-dependent hydrolase